VRPDLPPRTRGVIALMDENCTVCMLCARECPDWCIYIDSHKETVPPAKEGGRARTRNVLDRFAIDFALCMYCGICVEVCPFDALWWSPEFEYTEYKITGLLHEMGRLREWADTVPPPPPLDEGADIPAEVADAIGKAEQELEAARPQGGRGRQGGCSRRRPGSGRSRGRCSTGRRCAEAGRRARRGCGRDRSGGLRPADRRGQVRADRPVEGQGRLGEEAEGRGRNSPSPSRRGPRRQAGRPPRLPPPPMPRPPPPLPPGSPTCTSRVRARSIRRSTTS
jgi:formate hydrogenlyase subunit 6/NADH:ubiquinone oxidoreductase subunit I